MNLYASNLLFESIITTELQKLNSSKNILIDIQEFIKRIDDELWKLKMACDISHEIIDLQSLIERLSIKWADSKRSFDENCGYSLDPLSKQFDEFMSKAMKEYRLEKSDEVCQSILDEIAKYRTIDGLDELLVEYMDDVEKMVVNRLDSTLQVESTFWSRMNADDLSTINSIAH